MRNENWAEKLARYIAERESSSFEWGRNDCISFARGAIVEMTGEVPVEITWKTAKAAERVIKKSGGLAGAITAVLGEPIVPLLAQRGDVGLLTNAGREIAAVCEGAQWVAPAANGLARFELNAAKCAWRVL